MVARVRTFNDYEIRELLRNPNVRGIKNKSQIIYKNEFKYWAVLEKIKYPEKTAREIFETAGFNMNILNERTPQKRISYWMKRYKLFGAEYFIANNKYRYKAIDNNKIFSTKNITEENKTVINSLEKNNLLIHKLIIVIEKLISRL